MNKKQLKKLKQKRSDTLKEKNIDENVKGGVLPPLLLYFLGVPAIVAVLLWLIFFRG